MVKNAKKNFIASLTKRDGSLATSKEEIQEEFLNFYVGLLGIKQDKHGFHDSVIQNGPRVTPDQANLLAADYGPFLDKVAKTLLAWSGLNLSYAGKPSSLEFSHFWLRRWIESQVCADAVKPKEYQEYMLLKYEGKLFYC
ncbi:hypothetical protein M9H77_21473 [Catharanthus roseus]|uniref:Uncharacterized protein n=1 Tax=Catharanthus roseus TaxID=4058 RepID=A0ACC0APG8_CATRO|nr:hypothetical protein M9H77_21473 [Catharanthus roseus]